MRGFWALHTSVVEMRRWQRLFRQRRWKGLSPNHLLCLPVQVQQPEAVHPRVLQMRRHPRLWGWLGWTGVPQTRPRPGLLISTILLSLTILKVSFNQVKRHQKVAVFLKWQSRQGLRPLSAQKALQKQKETIELVTRPDPLNSATRSSSGARLLGSASLRTGIVTPQLTVRTDLTSPSHAEMKTVRRIITR